MALGIARRGGEAAREVRLARAAPQRGVDPDHAVQVARGERPRLRCSVSAGELMVGSFVQQLIQRGRR